MQSALEITMHPVDLSRHGKTPSGLPVYRVVWADTRTTTCLVQGKRHVLPRYVSGDGVDASGHWILEKWAPPEITMGMTREVWSELIAGFQSQFGVPPAVEQWPETGEYELSYIFPGEVDENQVHRVLALHEHNLQAQSDFDRAKQLEAERDAKEKAKREAFDERYEAVREESLCQK